MQRRLESVVDPGAVPEKVAGGFAFTEGPVFSRLGYLLFSDIPPNRIMKWQRGKVTVFRENSNGTNGLTFDHAGRRPARCQRRMRSPERRSAGPQPAEALRSRQRREKRACLRHRRRRRAP